jgi:hypothetical protein
VAINARVEEVVAAAERVYAQAWRALMQAPPHTHCECVAWLRVARALQEELLQELWDAGVEEADAVGLLRRMEEDMFALARLAESGGVDEAEYEPLADSNKSQGLV